MKVPEYVAAQTERMAESLAQFLDSTSADRLRWRPASEGEAETRSAFDQVSECVATNRLFATLLRQGAVEMSGGYPDIAFANVEDAKRQLRESATELATAIRALSEEDLQRDYRHPRAIIKGENLILMPFRNMAYHAGQINFIQTLYGDAEFHVPANWR